MQSRFGRPKSFSVSRGGSTALEIRELISSGRNRKHIDAPWRPGHDSGIIRSVSRDSTVDYVIEYQGQVRIRALFAVLHLAVCRSRHQLRNPQPQMYPAVRDSLSRSAFLTMQRFITKQIVNCCLCLTGSGYMTGPKEMSGRIPRVSQLFHDRFSASPNQVYNVFIRTLYTRYYEVHSNTISMNKLFEWEKRSVHQLMKPITGWPRTQRVDFF